MNILLLLAAILAIAVTVGHFTVGMKKEGSRCMTHYVSAVYVLGSAVLLLMALEIRTSHAMVLLVRVIALLYGSLAGVQFVHGRSEGAELIALFKKESLPDAAGKVTQWMVLAAVAVVAWVGANPDSLFEF
jgi:hypothetical protein